MLGCGCDVYLSGISKSWTRWFSWQGNLVSVRIRTTMHGVECYSSPFSIRISSDEWCCVCMCQECHQFVHTWSVKPNRNHGNRTIEPTFMRICLSMSLSTILHTNLSLSVQSYATYFAHFIRPKAARPTINYTTIHTNCYLFVGCVSPRQPEHSTHKSTRWNMILYCVSFCVVALVAVQPQHSCIVTELSSSTIIFDIPNTLWPSPNNVLTTYNRMRFYPPAIWQECILSAVSSFVPPALRQMCTFIYKYFIHFSCVLCLQ